MPELMMIPIEEIEENPEQLRPVDRDAETWPDFVEDVRKNGVLLPILVKRIDDDRYIIDDGLHRFTAACELFGNDQICEATGKPFDAVPCSVREAGDERDSLLLQISTNSQGVETKPAQFAQAIRKILDKDPLITIGDLANKLSKSASWLHKLLSLNNLIDEAKELVDKGKIKLGNAYALAKLPPEEQPEWLKKAQELDPDRFTPLAQARARELRRTNRSADDAPIYRPRKKQDIVEKFEALQKAGDTTDEYLRGQYEALAWVLRQDAVSEVDKDI